MAEIKVPALEADLKADPALLGRFKLDPKLIMKDYGLDIDDDAAKKIKDLIAPQIKKNLGNNNALYVVIKT